MKTRIIGLSAFLVVAAFTAVSQETPSPTRLTNDHYFDLERVSNAQISPDGAHIVYTRQQANKIEDRWDSSLWIMNADGSQHRFLTKGSDPRWSSDGKRILYIADGEPRGPQIFVRWIDVDGPATQVTHATEKVADARWSPDGKSIAFSMFVPAKDTWNISMPPAPEGAKWTGSPRRGGNAALSSGSGWLPRGRAHASVRRLGRWRRAPPDHERQVERGRRRIARRRIFWTGHPTAKPSSSKEREARKPICSMKPRNCWWPTSRPAPFASSSPNPAPGVAPPFRPTARPWRSRAIRNRSARTRWQICM